MFIRNSFINGRLFIKKFIIFILVGKLIIFPTLTFSASPQSFIESAGIYGLIPVNAPPVDPRVTLFLEHPQTAGISVRTNWRSIEAEEDIYDWTYIDAMLARAADANRQAILRISAGPNTPDWVFEAGAEEFIYLEPNFDFEEARMAVPWDPIFLEKWNDFVNELGSRYNNHPQLAAVIVTGASRSTEMHLPRTLDDQAQWQLQGYSLENITSAWRRVIDDFANTFPDTALMLAVSPVLITDGTVEAVVDYAIENYPWHLAIKIAFWSEINDPSFFPIASMLKAADDFTHGGLESVGEMDVPAAIQLALPWHTLNWMEIYRTQIEEVTPLFEAVQLHKQLVSSSCLQAIPNNTEIRLFWSRPDYNENFESIRLLRKKDGFPLGPNDPDAEVIFDGNSLSAIRDQTAEVDVVYHYSLYEIPSNYLIGQTSAQSGNITGESNLECEDDGDLDDDGLQDTVERILNTNFSNPDTDNDGESDFSEVNRDNDPSSFTEGIDTNPVDADTDNDGLLDGFEIENDFDPINIDEAELDSDADGLSNIEEQEAGTNPNKVDTDEDDLTDSDEINIYFTDPQLVDTDNDNLSDGSEVNVHLTNPTLEDTDADGTNDGDEIAAGTDPLDATSNPNTIPVSVPTSVWFIMALGLILVGQARNKIIKTH